VLQYALVFLTVFILRRREPTAPRPFRARGHPWTTGLVLAFSIAFLVAVVYADTRNSIYSLVLLGASWPVYRYVRPREASATT
jgi:APA family basic amino acid/polyamine antiporter